MDDGDRLPPSRAAASLTGGNRGTSDVGLGYIALGCALAAWLGEAMILLAELGWISRAVKLNGATLVVVGLFWLAAVGSGLVASVAWRSKFGCIAVVLCVLLPLGVLGLAILTGGGWLE